MKSAEKLQQKIEALRTELAEAKAAEKRAADEIARRVMDRAFRRTGLMPLLASGVLTEDRLNAEFHEMAQRCSELANATK